MYAGEMNIWGASAEWSYSYGFYSLARKNYTNIFYIFTRAATTVSQSDLLFYEYNKANDNPAATSREKYTDYKDKY